jgi:hypothetical protein
MNAAAVAVVRAEAAGIRLWLDGLKVRMEASAPPSPNVLTELRAHREEVFRLLAERAAAPDPGATSLELLPQSTTTLRRWQPSPGIMPPRPMQSPTARVIRTHCGMGCCSPR